MIVDVVYQVLVVDKGSQYCQCQKEEVYFSGKIGIVYLVVDFVVVWQ